MTGDRFIVVGGGIVGLATARELARRWPGGTVTVLEKERYVGGHQTGHNSGVVHAGLYYPPGSLKARLCTRGRVLLRGFCEEKGVPFVECGKLVVARTEAELGALFELEARARANGVPDIRRLDRAGLEEVEPHVSGVAALHSPRTAIVDFQAVARAIASDPALEVRLGFEVAAIEARAGGVIVRSSAGETLAGDRVVVCAGLQSDRVARLAGDGPEPLIVPFRGEYWRLVPARRHLVNGLVYPVPDPRYPFLGVHATRRVDGNVDLGPNAILSLGRERYSGPAVELADIRDLAGPPVLRMARRHWRVGLHELAGSMSKRVFVARAATLLPGLTASDVVAAPAGIRAQAVDLDGSLVDDFRVSRIGADGRVVAVRNAPSPAATSSLAIAEHLCDLVA